MQTQEIMTEQVVTINGWATVAEAIMLMKYIGLSSLVVNPADDSDTYGIVTKTDIVYKVMAFEENPQTIQVKEIVTKPCIVVAPELEVKYTARLFANTNVSHALVMKERLLGIVSLSDIFNR